MEDSLFRYQPIACILVFSTLTPLWAGWNAVLITSPGSQVNLNLPYNQNWILELEGKFNSEWSRDGGFARYLDSNRATIDLLTRNGRGLLFRLANKRIFFRTALKGGIHNKGGRSDH